MPTWLRFVLAIVVVAHGMGHILFFVSLAGLADWGQASESWLLGSGWLAKGLGSLIWLGAMAGFLAAAYGVYQEAVWWRTVLLVSTAVSTVGLILFWARPVSSPTLSALVFNLLALASLLLFQWPPLVRAGG
jgi:hypothetical protein